MQAITPLRCYYGPAISAILLLLQLNCFAYNGGYNPFKRDTIPRDLSRNYFYHAYQYGSQAQFNPLQVVLNRGFEMLRIRSGQPSYDPQISPYKFHNIIANLSSPFQRVKEYGTHDFFFQQVIPFGNRTKHYWYPNYTLHLIGGGITFTGLKEWYIYHKVPCPGILSAVTIMGSALINESIEERVTGPAFRLNVDVIADVWIFDIGGILLFQSKKVNRFFSRTLNMQDWSKQPTLLLPGKQLANCGQFISLKWKLPLLKNWYFFSMIGLGGMGGLSYKFKNGSGLSMGIGQGAKKKEVELFGLPIDVSLVPMGGIYYDKHNSLLASLEFSAAENDVYHNYFAELNLYPGLIRIKKIAPSLWMALAKDGSILFGVGTRYTLGLGIGYK